ncbi:hypothetical protein CLHUN_23610 [Ruminiclostridium hungatei]|uniref:Uncharacterized protein n=1 Tax=Ruminiclostridium hungatei TaxID=48256 RepID=A0A1V4SIB3_RUMHU|nr:hypothetical protein CLHUN_23610 [Ruminiclostridium hungatei]
MLNIDKNTKCSLNIEIFVIEYRIKIKSDFIGTGNKCLTKKKGVVFDGSSG